MFSHAYLAINGTYRLGHNGVITGTAATTNAATATMKQAQSDLMALQHFDQADFSLVQLPAGGNKATVLVAVRISQHDFLGGTATVDKFSVFGNG